MPERVSPIAAPTIMILIHTSHGGIGYAIGGGFNPALPPNKSLQANWQARFISKVTSQQWPSRAE
jgi:hypothetical protein